MADQTGLASGTVTIGGREIEVTATNRACLLYAEQFSDSAERPYTGHLIRDLLQTRQQLKESGESFPEWAQVPALLGAIWAMARAAGSTDEPYEGWRKAVEEAPANLYEPAQAYNALLGAGGIGERTFFRLPEGLGDALAPDEGQEG